MNASPGAKCVRVSTLGAFVLLLAACGGGGGGVSPGDNALVVLPRATAPLVSGGRLDYVLDVRGGCGGPYLMQVLQGALPPGVTLDAEGLALRGHLLQDGVYDVTLQVTDTGCRPFASATATLRLTVGVGPLAVVGATRDGMPGLLRPGDPGYDPAVYPGTWPAIPSVVYAEYATIVLVVAGGTAPYRAEAIDDPGLPGDGPLPLGTVIPEHSTSITGSPLELGPAGKPLLVTTRVRDAAGHQVDFTFWWWIRTPPIVVATEELADGTCGAPYSQILQVVDGVPPFVHEFVEAGPGVGNAYVQTAAPDLSGQVVYDPPGPVTVPHAGNLVRIDPGDYPPEDHAGPDYGGSGYVAPPEGLRLDEALGKVAGIPRRAGAFRVHYHVRSSLVPDCNGQHQWTTFEFAFAESAPLVQDPTYTVPGAFRASPPWAPIADADVGKAYNPDEGADGLQLRASGGVAKDGWTDAPHASQALAVPGEGEDQERPGAYDWTADLDPDGDGGNDPVPGLGLDGWVGTWRALAPELLAKQPPQEIRFTASDQQLPLSLRHHAAETVRFGVGPDTVIVTESTTSSTHNANTGGFSLNDRAQTVKVLEVGSGGWSLLRSPTSADLAGEGDRRHAVPSSAGSGTTLASLLVGLDLLDVSVNPTWWAYDTHQLNPRGARSYQHGDSNRYYPYYGTHYVYSNLTSGSGQPGYYAAMPNVTAVHLPAATGVTHDPAGGVYADGGKLYAFDAAGRFGLFVVRRDSRLYVPAAFDKSIYASFGDNWTHAHDPDPSAQSHPLNKIPQMTVSPDGRFGAMKLRTSTTFDPWERANTTDLLVFSLTGERPWGGKTWTVVKTGSSGTTAYGEVVFASSLTLTNQHLYYLVGNGTAASWAAASWKDHYLYRYAILGGAPAGALLPGLSMPVSPYCPSATNNTPGYPVQTPFQCFDRPFSSAAYGGQPDYLMVQVGGYNSWGGALAPHPFRVSADGSTCAFLAGPYMPYTTDTRALAHYVWADAGGTPARLSTTCRRHAHGGGRGYALRDGPLTFGIWQWGTYTGPTTAFEVSDDGKKVAAVYTDNTGAASHSSSSYWYPYREQVIAFKPASGQGWSGGATEVPVTSPCFTSSILWRFGALAFTKDGNGLVFWGGYSSAGPTGGTSYYLRARSLVGSLYGFDFTDPAPGVASLLGGADGGRSVPVGTKFTASNPNAPSTATWQVDGGVLKPVGGFLSRNREFLYLVQRGALVSSGADSALVGVNLRSADPTQARNGKPDFRAFVVGGMPARRGFLPVMGYYSAYGIGTYTTSDTTWYEVYAPGGTQGAGLQVSAADNGWVYFATHYQYTGPSSSATTTYGGPIYGTYHSDHGRVLGHVEVFDPDLGGDVQPLTGAPLGSRTTRTAGSYATDELRSIRYLEVADDGRQVAFVYRHQTDTDFNRERLAWVGNVALDPATGALLPGATFATLKNSNTRVADAMAHYALGGRLFASWGDTNENNRRIYEYAPEDGAPHEFQLPYDPARYNVLNAAR